MTARIRHNQFKGIFIIILFIILSLKLMVAQAQSSASSYKGFNASFGARSFAVSSNIAEIDRTDLIETGGQVGFIFGNNVIKSRLGLFGYFSSSGKMPGTVALYTSNASVNFYPLQLLMKRHFLIEPYVSAGMSYDRFKFFGYYVNQEPGVTNFSQAEAPYLGKIKQVNATTGLGLELRLRDDFDFIHLFTEIKYAGNLSSKANRETFAETTLKSQLHTVIGISFGANR